MRHRLMATTTAALVLALAAFTGTSLAGNGHGNGGGNGNDQSSQSSQPAAAPTSHGNSGTAPGNSSKQSDTSPSNPATSGNNSQGVKPTSTTKHETYAKASSGETKKYGNGKTAGQIATSKGYPDATLHGPGNSQPHKTTSCGHSHEVDVHALKSNGSACGGTAAAVHAKVHVKKTPPAKPVKPAPAPAPAPVAPAPAAAAAPAPMAHVTICHATGSSTNPYVRISPSVSGVYHGHLGHQDGRDIVPPFTYNGQTYSANWDSAGQAIYNNGCAAVSAAAATETPSTPSSTSTSAPAPAVVTTTPAPVVVTATPAPAAVAAGAVKGATVTLKPKTNRVAAAATTKPKPRGGVLGTTTRLGSTITSTKLPFTGLPLWIFVAVAAGLILIGAAVRRSAGSRI